IGLRQSLDRHLPLSQPSLDWLILTHPESSPVAAFEALGRHASPGILLGEAAGLEEEPAALTVEVVRARAGTSLALGDGARLEVIDPARGRTTLLVTYRSAAILVMESGTPSSEIHSAGSGASAVILLGEGQIVAKSLRQAWVGLPPVALVAAPLPGDLFLNPQDGDASVVPVLATPFNGWVRLSTDGSRLEIRAERVP
ncbi:MAG: hypothetical protein HW375_969, partial [Anaerolineales bacterium]|nr:hypothetical protein [Anaerolineales bacterium]